MPKLVCHDFDLLLLTNYALDFLYPGLCSRNYQAGTSAIFSDDYYDHYSAVLYMFAWPKVRSKSNMIPNDKRSKEKGVCGLLFYPSLNAQMAEMAAL